MKSKITIFILITALFSLISINCDKDTASTPTAPQPRPCETYNTASAVFENRSGTSTTYDVIWDGSRICVLGPGQVSDTFTVAAQIQHSLLFKISNTNNVACSESHPILPKCSLWNFWCTTD